MQIMNNPVPEEMTGNLEATVKTADFLFIVTPLYTTQGPLLEPLYWQSIGENAGFTCEVLYLNLLLAGTIGLDVYESLCHKQPSALMGERLFARAAHGLPALGREPAWFAEPETAVSGPARQYPLPAFEYKFYKTMPLCNDDLLKIETTCTALIETCAGFIASRNYRVAGCFCNHEQNNSAIALLNQLKSLNPGMTTFLSGSNCDGEMAEGLAGLCREVDFIISGEGETVADTFLRHYTRPTHSPCRIIKAPPVENPGSLPLPVPESFRRQYDAFIPPGERMNWGIRYETSRGCWWGKCAFCGLNGQEGKFFRNKESTQVMAELEKLHARFPGKKICMMDKVMPHGYKKTLLPLLAAKKGFPPIWYDQRSSLSFKDLQSLAEAGITSIQPGIEALSDSLLKMINKGITTDQNLLLLRHARCLNMHVHWNLLWGFPGEPPVAYKKTLALLPLLTHLEPPAVFRHISIDRFSRYFTDPAAAKIENLRPWASYSCVYPEHADISKLALRFTGDYTSCLDLDPGLITDVAAGIKRWTERWKQTHLIMKPLLGAYVIFDNRESPQEALLEFKQARETMVPAPYQETEYQVRAIKKKWAVVTGETYVPLVTASPNLLLELGM